METIDKQEIHEEALRQIIKTRIAFILGALWINLAWFSAFSSVLVILYVFFWRLAYFVANHLVDWIIS